MKNIRMTVWAAGMILLPLLLHAQDTTTTDQSGATLSGNVDWSLASESDLAVMLQAVEQTTPVSADFSPQFGTFWSAKHAPGSRSEWPPMPGDINGLPLWNLGENVWLVDDLDFSYRAAQTASLVASGGVQAMDDSFSPPGLTGGGSGNTNTWGGVPINFGTNIWLAQVGLELGSGQTSGYFLGIISNSVQDIPYELQFTTTNVTLGEWQSAGFVYGSELTNWTAWNLPISNPGNLFIRVRSWQDSTGTGIPDWWWLYYFGQITNVSASSSATGDAFSNLQKFQMGLVPTNYYNPNGVMGFVGSFDFTGTNVVLDWSNTPGPVLDYVIWRGVYDYTTGNYDYSLLTTVNSNTTFFVDVGANYTNAAQNYAYQIAAAYPGNAMSATNIWDGWWYIDYANQGPPSGPAMPNNVYAYLDSTGTNVLLSWTQAQGSATGYIIQHGIYDSDTYYHNYSIVGQVSSNTTAFKVTGVMTNIDNWSDDYTVAAVYAGGGLSFAVSTFTSEWNSSIGIGSSNGPAAPSNFYGYTDSTGTNIYLNWTHSPGSVTNYLIWGGNINAGPNYVNTYELIGKVSSSATSFEVAGAINGSGNNIYGIYCIAAVYPDGSLSQSATWTPNSDATAPTTLNAYVDSTGTNVVVAWSPVTGATGYIIQRCDDYSPGSGGNYFYQIGQTTNAATTSFIDVDEVDNAPDGIDVVGYQVQATFSNGGLSPAVTAMVSSTPPAPTGLSAIVDSTGTNVILSWTAAVGGVSNYIVERGVYNPSTGTYSYSQVGQTSATTFTDTGAITANNSYNNVYEVIANYSGGQTSAPDEITLGETISPPGQNQPDNDITLSAQLVRNQTGRWQLMFSGLSTNIQTIVLNWYSRDYLNDSGEYAAQSLGYPFNVQTFISTNQITNGIYVIPDNQTLNAIVNGIVNYTGPGWSVEIGPALMMQPIAANGVYGNQSLVGLVPGDEPAFADGRQCLWQNLLFELRASSISQPNTSLGLPADTNYVESSIFHWAEMYKGYYPYYVDYMAMDDLWPFTANYQLHGNLYDPNYNGPSSFTWQNNLATVPAPAVLGIGDPYWISQSFGDPSDFGVSTNSGMFYLASGVPNLFGLTFETALVNEEISWSGIPGQPPTYGTPITVAPGTSTGMTNVNCFFSQTSDPSLQLVNYYFAQVVTPGKEAPNENPLTEPYPLPTLSGFANTNQTGVLIASVGAPTVIGGWARFSLQNSSKCAYLGQYFETNACMLDEDGNITTNTTGVVSPYGDFFPTGPGNVVLSTMPDYNNDAPGTNTVHVISLNVDANHDGTMDFSYFGPDQTSQSRPFRFWVDDSTDDGDYGGNGIPGQGAEGNGLAKINGQWAIHGRRDLVNFFPVYINVGSLFQNTAWGSGISATDTNWQFVLSQADGALRFVYTDLTTNNYMNFLYDLTETSLLTNEPTTTITQNGVTLGSWFFQNMLEFNQGIILVQAWTNTTQPLVLTIYHGTNQIAQTSLYLSTSGVEQMFRSKTMMLNSEPETVPNRLTDADVPNEPDTKDANFVFVHGYNVNPQQARGVAADTFKRMYWSGSHAKFWAVTWEGADTQGWLPGLADVTTDYHSNVFNAFNTAPAFSIFVASLPGGPVVVTAHSLGNMVVLDALNEYSAPINQYFMLDAAVAMEAIDPSTGTNIYMVDSAWQAYSNRLYAANWHNVWTNTDYRSLLAWSGRLTNFNGAQVYNFYSSGEEVLREWNVDPPTNILTDVAQIAANYLSTYSPVASYVWVWQEKSKGIAETDWLLGSTHGGWKFNTNYASLTIAQADALQAQQLQTNAFFDLTSPSFGTADLALCGSLGNAYAYENRNRILSDAIPALSFPVGANLVPSFSPPISPTLRNFDMQASYENGWPLGRPPQKVGITAPGEWWHSDFHQVAYTFTYQLFNQLATVGNLK
jgi:hypothetical protein